MKDVAGRSWIRQPRLDGRDDVAASCGVGHVQHQIVHRGTGGQHLDPSLGPDFVDAENAQSRCQALVVDDSSVEFLIELLDRGCGHEIARGSRKVIAIRILAMLDSAEIGAINEIASKVVMSILNASAHT